MTNQLYNFAGGRYGICSDGSMGRSYVGVRCNAFGVFLLAGALAEGGLVNLPGQTELADAHCAWEHPHSVPSLAVLDDAQRTTKGDAR